jgi:ABC-type sugar transport system ATPase subunit
LASARKISPQEKGEGPLKVAVAELLGHEYYVHSDFAGIDLVAKIPLTHEIKIGDPITGWLRTSRRRTSSIRTSEKCIL